VCLCDLDFFVNCYDVSNFKRGIVKRLGMSKQVIEVQ